MGNITRNVFSLTFGKSTTSKEWKKSLYVLGPESHAGVYVKIYFLGELPEKYFNFKGSKSPYHYR